MAPRDFQSMPGSDSGPPPGSSGSPQSRTDSAELILLSILSEGPLYGYAITKRVKARSNGAASLSPGVLYPLLHELEQTGLILSEWEDVRSGRRTEDDEAPGRRRKWYRLSAKGRKRLDRCIHAHRSYVSMIESFLSPPPPPGEPTP